MNKSLTPLIVFFSMVIVMTFVIVNSRLTPIEFVGDQEQNLSDQPHRPRVQMRLAKLDQEKQDGGAAPVKLSSLPNLRQGLEQARYLLSIGEPDKAEDTLRTLLVFYPDDFDALSLLGGLLYAAGRYDEAVSTLRQRLRVAPDVADAHEDLALALESSSRNQQAIEEFLKASALSPGSARASLKLAGIYALLGDRDKGLKHFADAYSILGSGILAFAFDPTFANLRNTPQFILIMAEAENIRHDKDAAAAKDTPKP